MAGLRRPRSLPSRPRSLVNHNQRTKKARRSTDGALMFVLLLMEICRSLFDGLHLNSDERKRAVRSFERLLGAHRRRTQIYSAGSVISEFACQRHHQWH
jgi:hypothetical protein